MRQANFLGPRIALAFLIFRLARPRAPYRDPQLLLVSDEHVRDVRLRAYLKCMLDQ